MNSNDADHIFGAANIERVEIFRINGETVDFGDWLHFGGAAQGDALICWLNSGRVAVKGVLFSDNFREAQTAIVEIKFRHTDGRFTNLTRRSISAQAGLPIFLTFTDVMKVSPDGQFDQVNIRLKRFQVTALGPVTTLAGTRTFTR